METTKAATPSAFRAVNLLYFIVLGLMAANILFMWMPQYVRLTLNELLFVLLPAYLYLHLRLGKTQGRAQAIARRVRWRWPGWRVALLALAVGGGLYPLSAMSAGVLMGILGYSSFAAPADAIPTTLGMGLLAVLSYAVLAPLCEEFLFRGVIQPVYETRGAAWGVLFVGFLFIAFHLSLLQGLSIILLSLALGYVNYRTRSLPASILTHFGANGLAALVVTHQVFPTGIQNWITSLPALAGGLALAAAALFALIRLTRGTPAASPLLAQETLEPPPAPAGKRPAGWLWSAWPLLAALLIYLPLTGAEFVFSRSPALAAGLQAPGPAVQPGTPPWAHPKSWRYEIRNVADTVVGQGECRLTPLGEQMEITCASNVEAYEVKQGQSTFMSSGGKRTDRMVWQAAGGKIVSGSLALDLQGGFRSQTDFNLGDDRLIVRYTEGQQPETNLDLPFAETARAQDPDLVFAPDNTWPWQLAALCGSAGKTEPQPAGSVIRFSPYTWIEARRTSGPLAETRAIVVDAPVEAQSPAGSWQGCSIASGSRETAWYADVDGSLAVVKYHNGIETWYLLP